MHTMFCDFRDGRKDAELENDVHTVIANIAGLKDHLRHWCKAQGIDQNKVHDAIRASRPLQIIFDLEYRKAC